jgi:hypothetical protein
MRDDALLANVKKILFEEWDPIGVNHFEKCRDEYDNYALRIEKHLLNGVDEYWLESFLQSLAENAMGLPTRAPEKHRKAAKLLLELVRNKRD